MAKQDQKIGQILISNFKIPDKAVAEALHYQITHNSDEAGRRLRLGEILLFQGALKLEQLHAALRAQTSKAQESRLYSLEAKEKVVSAKLQKMRVELDEKKSRTSFRHFLRAIFGTRRS